MTKRERLPVIARVLALAALVTLSALGCDPVTASHEMRAPVEPPGPVGLTLDQSDMQLLVGLVSRLRVCVFQVIEDIRGPQEGADSWFPMSDSGGAINLSRVTVGDKEIEVELLDDDGNVLGRGATRVTIGFGAQTASQSVRIRLVPASERRIRKDIALDIQIVDPANANLVTYQSVKPILERHCNDCHRADFAAGGFASDWFPFALEPEGIAPITDQFTIVPEMISSMRDVEYPMPPAASSIPRVPASDVATVDQWRNDGLLVSPPVLTEVASAVRTIRCIWRQQNGGDHHDGDVLTELTRDAAGQFVGSVDGLLLAGIYDVVIEGRSASGGLVFTRELGAKRVSNRQAWVGPIVVPYVAPNVDVPVVVDP